MKFQIEEYPETKLCKLLNCLGTFSGKELAAYLEDASGPSKLPRQGASWPGAVNVKGDY